VIAAAIVARSGVAVEKAVLPLGVDVVARDARTVRRFVVVGGTGALQIGRVDASVAVVVDAVGALRRSATSCSTQPPGR
jgi:hypothetical protein